MQSIARYKDLLLVLTQKELKVRYKNLGLGYLWSLGNPLAYGTIYYFIFKSVMKVQIEDFPLFLVTGLFPWQWIANSVGVAWATFIANAPLIKKVNFPRYLLPLVVSLQDMIHFAVSLPIIFFFMYMFGKPFSPILLVGVPLMLLIQLLYSYSLGLFISTVNLFFRDLERLIGIFMTFLFYLTPIVYVPEMVPEKYKSLLLLNPVTPLIMNWRELFLHGNLDWIYLAASFGYGVVFVVIAQYVYRRLVWRFAEVL